MTQKQTLPNSGAVLTLGICSIVFGCFFVGLILGIIGISLSSKGMKMYNENPSLYDGNGVLNAGRILSIIGTVLGGVYAFYYIVVVAYIGGTAFSLARLLNH